MLSRIVTATRAVPAGTPDDEVLRVACHAFLAFVAGEPDSPRSFTSTCRRLARAPGNG